MLLCLSGRGWDRLLVCGGLDSSVEPASEGSLETASDVAMGLACAVGLAW
jgi:hypothetical protein